MYSPSTRAASPAHRLILVLGMHRSGTSAFARALGVFGVELGGSLLPAHPCNPKGFFEDEDVYAFNKALLAFLGLTWHAFPPADAARLHAMAVGGWGRDALDLLREKMAGHRLFGLKDPRISALLPFWRPVLAASQVAVHCVICLRHPDSVAQSLLRRDGMAPEHSHALWAAHTLGAIQGSSGLPRTCAGYEALLRQPEDGLARLGKALDLAPDPEERQRFIADFLDSSLCHHSAAPGSGPDADTAENSWRALARNIHATLCPATGEAPDLDSPELARHMGTWLAQSKRLAPPPDFMPVPSPPYSSTDGRRS